MSKLKALLCQRTLVLFLLVILLLAVPGCRVNPFDKASPVPTATPRQEPLPTPTPRTELPVSKSPATLALSLSGEVRAKEQVVLAAKLTGRIAELKVGVGDLVKKNDLLVVLEHEALDVQVKQAEAGLKAAEAGLRAAEAALKGAQAQLDLLQAGATKEQIAAAEAAVSGAEASLALLLAGATKEQIAGAEAALTAAQARLDLLLAGPKPEQLKIAESQVEMAGLGIVITDYRTSTYPPAMSVGTLEAYMKLRDEELKLARLQVDMAKYQLELLKAPPRPEEVAQLKAAVEGTRAQLEALKAPPRPQQVAQLKAAVEGAMAQLEGLKTLPRPQQVAQLEAAVEGVKAQVALAQAQVALAQASLLLAKTQREEDFLYSPLDGVVAYRGLGIGSLASAGVPILTIMSREVEVVIAVDEVALGQVRLGQAVSITAPAYPSQVFAGKVRAVAPGANPATRTFEVYIDPQDPKGLLRPGMSTTVSLSKSEGL